VAIVHSKHNLSLSTNAGPSFNAYVDTVKKRLHRKCSPSKLFYFLINLKI